MTTPLPPDQSVGRLIRNIRSTIAAMPRRENVLLPEASSDLRIFSDHYEFVVYGLDPKVYPSQNVSSSMVKVRHVSDVVNGEYTMATLNASHEDLVVLLRAVLAYLILSDDSDPGDCPGDNTAV